MRASNAAVLGLTALCVVLLGLLTWSVRQPPVVPGPAPFPSYADVFDSVAPSVVAVRVEHPSRVGSGFAVSDTDVVTARHLVVDAVGIVLRDATGRQLPAVVVGTDARADLALLRVEGGLSPARLGTTKALRVGDTVLAIGNPFGLGQSLSVGVVGHRGRRLVGADDDLPRVDFVQLSIPLYPGNSGGPIYDNSGEVVGVLSGLHAQGQSIAFAVPIEALRDSLGALAGGARMSRAFLGLTSRGADGSLEVVSVVPAGPADRAGIRSGDQLSAFDGIPVAKPADLQGVLDRLAGGTQTSARLLRDGQLQVVDVELADRAEQAVVSSGMTLRPAPGAGGEVVAVRPRSRAEAAGIRVGDLVRSVDGVPVRAPADVKDALTGRAAAQLDLVRGGVPLSVQLPDAG